MGYGLRAIHPKDDDDSPIRVWSSGYPQASPTQDAGQCDCDCNCDCACPEAPFGAETATPLKAWADGRPPRLAANLHLSRQGRYTWVVPPAAPGVLVFESSHLERLLAGGPLSPRLARLGAVLAQAGVLQPSTGRPRPPLAEPLTAYLALSESCSLACAYCYIHPTPRSMSVEVARQAVQAVFRSARANGYERVRLKYAGGEATLNFTALLAAQAEAERLAQAGGLKLETVLLTNGLQVSSHMVTALLARRIAVMVSLDGLRPFHDRVRPTVAGGGSFVRVERTLDRLQQAGIHPFISVTLTSETLDGLPDLAAYLIARHLRFSLNFYRPGAAPERLALDPGRLLAALEQTYAVIESHLPAYSLFGGLTDRASLQGPHAYACQAGRSYLVIDADGGVAACQMDLDRPYTTIYAPDPLAEVRQTAGGIHNPPVWEKECADCSFADRCAAGCVRETLRHSGGNPAARSPLCRVYRAILPQAARLEALRLLRYAAPLEF